MASVRNDLNAVRSDFVDQGQAPADLARAALQIGRAEDAGWVIDILAGGAGLVKGLASGLARSAEALLAREAAPVARSLSAAVSPSKFGFASDGTPVILDENMMARGLVEALREAGYNVRSIQEVFGRRGVLDKDILDLARDIGAKVLTRDRGRQIDGGFFELGILVDPRATSACTISRILDASGISRSPYSP